METNLMQFLAQFIPLESVPAPILAAFGFVLAFLALYMLLSLFCGLFRGASYG